MNLDNMRNIRRATPLLALSLFLGLFFVMYFSLNINSIEVTDKAKAIDHNWRLFWGLSVVLLVMALTWSYVNSAKLIQKYLAVNGKKVTYSVSAVLILIVVVMSVFPFDFGGNTGDSLQGVIFSHTQINVAKITDAMNVYAALTIFMLAVSAALLSMDTHVTEGILREKTRDIHKSLYSSSVLLAAGIIEIYCLYSWPAALQADIAYNSIVSKGIIASAGVFFTLILAIIYVPLFMSRNELLNSYLLKKNFSSKDEIENWYAVNHLEKRSGGNVSDVLAFALPILTGVLVNVLSEQFK